MERIPRAIYTKELREEAVKLVRESGFSIPEVGRRLSVATSTIRYWVKAHKEGKLKEVGKQQKPLTEVEMELARVKRELAEVRMERDILESLLILSENFLSFVSSARDVIDSAWKFYTQWTCHAYPIPQ